MQDCSCGIEGNTEGPDNHDIALGQTELTQFDWNFLQRERSLVVFV
jgi:hypothetical protein